MIYQADGRGSRQLLGSAVALTAAVAVGLLVLWRLSQVLLVVFAAVLLAVLLDGLTRLVRRVLPVGHGVGLAIAVLLIVGVSAGFVRYAGPQVNEQLAQLGERLPQAMERLEGWLEARSWTGGLIETPKPSRLMPSPSDLMGQITGVFSTALGALLTALVVLIVGLYLAANPGLYVRGLVLLIPPERQERVRAVLGALGHALRWWLVGRLASMVIVGALTGLGLWLIGMPLVLTLGLVAGLFSFIPMIGPILAAVPAVLIALLDSSMQVLYVGLVYWAAQILEGNFITPLIQQRTVSLAPAVLIVAQLIMGVLFGFAGVTLATPLAVVALVTVQMLYIQDMLGARVRVLGTH